MGKFSVPSFELSNWPSPENRGPFGNAPPLAMIAPEIAPIRGPQTDPPAETVTADPWVLPDSVFHYDPTVYSHAYVVANVRAAFPAGAKFRVRYGAAAGDTPVSLGSTGEVEVAISSTGPKVGVAVPLAAGALGPRYFTPQVTGANGSTTGKLGACHCVFLSQFIPQEQYCVPGGTGPVPGLSANGTTLDAVWSTFNFAGGTSVSVNPPDVCLTETLGSQNMRMVEKPVSGTTWRREARVVAYSTDPQPVEFWQAGMFIRDSVTLAAISVHVAYRTTGSARFVLEEDMWYTEQSHWGNRAIADPSPDGRGPVWLAIERVTGGGSVRFEWSADGSPGSWTLLRTEVWGDIAGGVHSPNRVGFFTNHNSTTPKAVTGVFKEWREPF